MLLEHVPAFKSHESPDPRANHIVTVSAQSAQSLQGNLSAIADFIGNSTPTELLSQISYTTTARRMHHKRRVVVSTSGLQHLKQHLLETAAAVDNRSIPSKPPAISFLFTGQEAQETAMAHGLYQHFSSFRSDILNFDAIARFHKLPSILPFIDGSAPIDQLSPTVVQLGTCII